MLGAQSSNLGAQPSNLRAQASTVRAQPSILGAHHSSLRGSGARRNGFIFRPLPCVPGVGQDASRKDFANQLFPFGPEASGSSKGALREVHPNWINYARSAATPKGARRAPWPHIGPWGPVAERRRRERRRFQRAYKNTSQQKQGSLGRVTESCYEVTNIHIQI